ncbi:MAG: oligosaccharide flippase family protein [bacterium]|nr:oligosaccharide flippase family protein [bacterium]
MHIFKNTLYQLIMKFITAGTSLVITIVIARYFGLSGYGDFIKITAYVGLFYLFTDFGLNAIFLQRSDQEVRFRDLLYLRIIAALIFASVSIAVSFLLLYNRFLHAGFSEADRLGIAIFSLTIITQAIVFSAVAIFQKKLRYDLYMKASAVGSISTLGFVGISVFLSLPLYYIFASFVMGGIITAVIALYSTKERIVPLSLNVASQRSLIRESLPLGVMLVFSFIYFRIDVFLLSVLRPVSEVGIDGLAGKFFEFIIAVPLFLSNAIYPTLLEKQRFGNFLHHGKKYLIIFIVLSFVVLIPFWFLSPLVSLIKPEFSPAIVPLRILLIFLPFFFATSILQWILIARKKQIYLMYVYIGATVANISLNLIFIPKYSYIASAIITGVVEAIVFIPLFIMVFLMPKLYQKELKNP